MHEGWDNEIHAHDNNKLLTPGLGVPEMRNDSMVDLISLRFNARDAKKV